MAHLTPTSGRSNTEMADVLSRKRRREALAILQNVGAPVALADLARDLWTGDADGPVSEADFEAVERCYARLYHVDVPKLVDVGVVTFDPDRMVVSASE